jgi:hypothetical protein
MEWQLATLKAIWLETAPVKTLTLSLPEQVLHKPG